MFPLGLSLMFKQAKSIYSSLTDLIFSFSFRNNSLSQIHFALYQIPLKPATIVCLEQQEAQRVQVLILFPNHEGSKTTQTANSMHAPADTGTSQPQATEQGKLPVPVLPQLVFVCP